MTVCKFWLQGNCRFGNTCKFEHPSNSRPGLQTGNRFGPLAGQSGQAMSSGGGQQGDPPPYPGLTAEAIQRDLTSELPKWILSCYSPAKDAPEQLFGGYPREQSFEEIRLHYMQGAMAGNPQGALNDIQALYQNAQQQIQNALGNIPAAIQFVVDGANKHPNRIDICKSTSGGAAGSGFGSTANPFQTQQAPSNPFGAPAAPAPAASAFGQPAALGQRPSPFGAPAFGQAAQPAVPAFGQPAGLGGGSAFGRPPQTSSAFGQTGTLGPKPSPFGAPASGQPAFGQPSAPGQSAFGQPVQSAFGQTPQPAQSAFGQPAALGPKPSPFGAPAAGTTQPTTSPFGQPTQPAQQASPFGQTAITAPASNPFGQATPATNAFGQQPAAAQVNPFGQPQQQPVANPFGAPAATATTNVFGQSSNASPFGAPAAAAAPGPPSNPFGQPSTSTPAFGGSAGTTAAVPGTASQASGAGPYGPDSSRRHPDLSEYSAKDPDGRLRMFKGKPVSYETPKGAAKPVPFMRNFDGSLVKIWMPGGAPDYTTESEAEPAKYEDPRVMQQWKAFVETGRFADGIMPEVPPKREFCTWDF